MDALSFIASVIVITASGALAPGLLFFAAISHGTRSGAKGGLLFSIGHTLVEFPLVVLLALGLLTAANQQGIKLFTGIIGGLALLAFGILQIHGTLRSRPDKPSSVGIYSRSPLLLGLIFTGLNPYFIVWWLTIGGKIIEDALIFGSFAGVLLMYVSHVWMDYAWLTGVAYLARVGTNVLGSKAYRTAMALFGVVLIYFGLTFLLSVFNISLL